MTNKILFFDYRKSEEKFFKQNEFDNYEIKFLPQVLNRETVKNLSDDDLKNTTVISVFISSDIDNEVISKFKNLRLIATRSTGFDHICLESCAERNIAIINVDSYGELAVAQFAIGLILLLVRKIFPALKLELDKTFVNSTSTGHNLNSMILGVIGTGTIGSAVAKYARCLGMSVVAYDRKQNEELIQNYNVRYVELDELLRFSDVISLHLPYNHQTYHIMSEKQFSIMKDGGFLVNVSRGELIDNDAMVNSLESGKLGGVGLDVVSCVKQSDSLEERREKSSVFCVQTSETIKKLLQYPNVVITPHIAYDTQEAIDYILQTTFEGIADYLSGGFKYRVI